MIVMMIILLITMIIIFLQSIKSNENSNLLLGQNLILVYQVSSTLHGSQGLKSFQYM